MEEVKIKRAWNPTSAALLIILHVAALCAITYGVIYSFSLGSWMLFGILFSLNLVGGTLGYHRFITHGSFQCAWPFKLFLLICGGSLAMGSAIEWARNHRTHHLYADREGDLHSPKDGFFWAHMEWVLFKYTTPDEKTICPDLLKDRLIVSQKYWWPLATFAWIAIPFALFGWEGLMCAGLLRLFVATHAILAINSVCHTWGERPYATKDTSTNNRILAWLIPSGEPFHNNHHADPKCAYLGWKWYDPDIGKWILQILSLLRLGGMTLVWNVRKPRPEYIKKLYTKEGKVKNPPSTEDNTAS